MWEQVRFGEVLDVGHVWQCLYRMAEVGWKIAKYFPILQHLPPPLLFPTDCSMVTFIVRVAEIPITIKNKKGRQSFAPQYLLWKCIVISYFSESVLTLLSMRSVMYGMIVWLFRRSGIHVISENITVPTFIIAHTEDLEMIFTTIVERKGMLIRSTARQWHLCALHGTIRLVLSSSCPLRPGQTSLFATVPPIAFYPGYFTHWSFLLALKDSL